MLLWAHPSLNLKRHLDRFSRFCTGHGRASYTLQKAIPSPLKLPFPSGSGSAYNWWFLGSTRVLNPNGISIGSAVFIGLTTVILIDRQTDRPQYSVCIITGRIYVQDLVLRCGLTIYACLFRGKVVLQRRWHKYLFISFDLVPWTIFSMLVLELKIPINANIKVPWHLILARR